MCLCPFMYLLILWFNSSLGFLGLSAGIFPFKIFLRHWLAIKFLSFCYGNFFNSFPLLIVLWIHSLLLSQLKRQRVSRLFYCSKKTVVSGKSVDIYFLASLRCLHLRGVSFLRCTYLGLERWPRGKKYLLPFRGPEFNSWDPSSIPSTHRLAHSHLCL